MECLQVQASVHPLGLLQPGLQLGQLSAWVGTPWGAQRAACHRWNGTHGTC